MFSSGTRGLSYFRYVSDRDEDPHPFILFNNTTRYHVLKCCKFSYVTLATHSSQVGYSFFEPYDVN